MYEILQRAGVHSNRILCTKLYCTQEGAQIASYAQNSTARRCALKLHRTHVLRRFLGHDANLSALDFIPVHKIPPQLLRGTRSRWVSTDNEFGCEYTWIARVLWIRG